MSLPPFTVTILGTSSATPAYGRFPSAQVVQFHQRLFLIDCGEAAQFQLRKYHFSIQKIEKIFISHLHGDHFFGFFGLIGSMQLQGRKRELLVYAPPELEHIFKTIYAASDASVTFPLKFIHLKSHSKELIYEDDAINVYSFPMNHRVPCFGFVFQEKPFLRKIRKEKVENLSLLPIHYDVLRKGEDVVLEDGRILKNSEYTIPSPPPGVFVHCSDTFYTPLYYKNFFDSPDLLYHEATFSSAEAKRAELTFHSTANQAAQAARDCGAKKLIIGHFSARYKELTPLLEEARAVFRESILAEEGLTVNIRDGFPVPVPVR